MKELWAFGTYGSFLSFTPIMQGSLNINPVVIFFALLIGAKIAGLIGMFLSIPIAGVLISLLDVEDMRGKNVQ